MDSFVLFCKPNFACSVKKIIQMFILLLCHFVALQEEKKERNYFVLAIKNVRERENPFVAAL